MNAKDTKSKIVESASLLFAEKGYEGASVRDIASHAEVNISAINYHFENKENLYNEVLNYCHLDFKNMVEAIYNQKQWNTVDFVESLFHTICEKGPLYVANFKLFLSEQKVQFVQVSHDETIGPPGGEMILKCIVSELGTSIPKDDLLWAVRTLFSQMAYYALLVNTAYAKREKVKDFMNKSFLSQYIRRTTLIVLKDLSDKFC